MARREAVHWFITGFLAAALLMMVVAAGTGGSDVGRYLVNAAGGSDSPTFFVLDTRTGEVQWMVRGDSAIGKRQLLHR